VARQAPGSDCRIVYVHRNDGRAHYLYWIRAVSQEERLLILRDLVLRKSFCIHSRIFPTGQTDYLLWMDYERACLVIDDCQTQKEEKQNGTGASEIESESEDQRRKRLKAQRKANQVTTFLSDPLFDHVLERSINVLLQRLAFPLAVAPVLRQLCSEPFGRLVHQVANRLRDIN